MAEELLNLVAKVSLDDNNFKSGLKNVQSQAKSLAGNVKNVFSGIGNNLKNIGKTMSNWGKAISVGITAPITALGVATAKTSIDFLKLKENTRTAFKVLLGSAEEAEKMLNDLYTFAKTTPFSYDTYLQAGKQLVAMGVAAKDAIPYLDGITNAAIATGAGQEGITTLSEAIGRMSSKGKVQLEELNRMIEMGIPAVKILGNAYGKTEMQIYDMMKKGELLTDEALPKLIDGMNNGTNGVNGMTSAYGGLASEMKGTLAGALDSLRSKFRNMSVEMWNSEEAYPILQEVIRSFTKTLEVLPKVFVSLTKAVVPILTVVNEKLKAFGEYLDNADPKQLEAIGKAILGLAVAGPVLIVVGKLIRTLGELFTLIGSISKAFSTISSVLSAVASVGFVPLLAIITAVIGVFVFLRSEWDKVVSTFTGWIEKTGILKSFQSLKEQVGNVLEKLGGLKDLFYVIGGIITTMLIPTIAMIMGVFNGLIKALDGIMKVIGGVIDVLVGIGEILLGIFTFDGEKILSGFKTLWQGIKDIFIGTMDSIWKYINGYFEGLWSFISSLLESIGLTEWLLTTWDNISKWFSNILTGIREWGQNLYNSMAEWFLNTLNGITAWFSDTWNNIVSWSANLWNDIQNFFTTIGQIITVGFMLMGSIIEASWQIITLPFMFIWENCKQYVFDIFNAISEFLTNIWNSILDFLIPTLQSISDFFKTTWENIKNTTVNILSSIWSAIQSTFNTVLSFIVTIFNNILSALITIWNNIKDSVTSILISMWNAIKSVCESIWSSVVSIFNSILNATLNVWNSIKNAISNVVNSVWNTVQNVFNNIKNSIISTWNSVKSTTTNVWNSIKNAITQQIQSAFNSVKNLIDRMKGLFNFSWSLPKIKLPHFSINGSFSLNPPSVPRLGIEWYKKGAILNDPTIFGVNPYNNNFMVGGEAGAEAIAPIDTLQDYVREAINENQNNTLNLLITKIFELLKEYLPTVSKQKLVLDTGAVVGELSPCIDYNLGNINTLKVRGN